MFLRAKYLALASLGCLALSGSAFAAKTYYRYTNEQGVTVLDDRIPAKYVKQGYAVVDSHGKEVKVVPPMRTEAERSREQRLQARRDTQERLRREQEANDRVLLKTFTNANDILRVRDNKLQALDSTIKIIEGTINRLKDQLQTHLKEAANKERAGEEVPLALHVEIEDIQAQITNNRSFIEAKVQEKLAIGIKAKVDLKRYKELMGDHSAEAISETADVTEPSPELYRCPDLAICNRAWTLSQIYVQKYATTSIQLLTNTLIASGQPDKEDDISLAVTKTPQISGATEMSIEAHCHLSQAGADLCHSDKVLAIIAGFYQHLTEQLGESSELEESEEMDEYDEGDEEGEG